MLKLYKELKHRKVLKTLGVYGAAALVIINIVTSAFPYLNLPDWTVTFVIVLVILGFPITFFLSWTYDLTRGSDNPSSDGEVLIVGEKSKKILLPITGLLTIIGGAFWVWYSMGSLSHGSDIDSKIFQSIAVLYLENLSGDLEGENWCAGLTDGIITSISKLGIFNVKSRTDVLQFRRKVTSHDQIGEILGVDAYITGSLQRVGEKVFANISLIDTRSGVNIWAERFEKTSHDIFNIPKIISKEIARSLGIDISSATLSSSTLHEPRDNKMFSLLGKGINLLDSGDFNKSIAVFDSVLINEPDNIRAIFSRGQAFEGKAKFVEAIENYTQIMPDNNSSSRSIKIFPTINDTKPNKNDKIRFLVSKELNIQLVIYQNNVDNRTEITAIDLSANTEIWSKVYPGIGYRADIDGKYFILSSSSFIGPHATIFVHNLLNSTLIFSKEFTRSYNEELVMVSTIDFYKGKRSPFRDHIIINVRRNDYYQISLLDLNNKSIAWVKTIPLQAVAEGDPRIYAINDNNENYFLHQKGLNFYLYNAKTGDRMWKKTLDDDTDKILVHNNKLIYYSTEHALISIQDPINNKIISTLELSAPSINAFGADDNVILQSSVGFTSIKTHKPFLRSVYNWKFSIDDDSIPSGGNVFMLGEKIFAFTKAGDLYCVSKNNGEIVTVNKLNEYVRWGFITDQNEGVAKGLVLYADDFIIGLDPINGKTLWKIRELNIDHIGQQIRFIDNKLIVGKEADSQASIILKAYNRTSGKLLWHSNERISTNETEIIYINSNNNSLYVGTKNLELFSFNVDWTPDKNYIPTTSILNRLAYCHYKTQNILESENILKEIVGSIDQQNEEAYLQLSDLYLYQQNNQNYISTLSSYYELIQHDELKRGRIENKLAKYGALQWVQNLRKKYDVVLHSSSEGLVAVSDCDNDNSCTIQAFRNSSGIKLWEKSFSNTNFIFSSEQSGKFIFASRNSYDENKNSVFKLLILDAAGRIVGEYILCDEEKQNHYKLWNVYSFDDQYIIDATSGGVRYVTAIDKRETKLRWEIELDEYRIQRARPIDIVRSENYLVVPVEEELRFIDIYSGREDWVFDYTEDIEGVAFLSQEGVSDNTLSFLSEDDEFVVLDMSGKSISFLEEVDFREPLHVHFLNEAYIFAFSTSGSMFLYKRGDAEIVPIWNRKTNPIRSIIMSENSIYIYHVEHDFLTSWNFLNGKMVSEIPLMWDTTDIFISAKLIGGFTGNKLYILNL